MFGSSTTKPAFGSTTGTSNFTFPSTTATTTTSSLFGSSLSTPNKPLFGATTTAATTPMFGGATTNTTTGSLFSTPSATATSSTGLFGGSTSGGSSSLFTKRSASTGLFGTPATTTAPTGTGLFGGSIIIAPSTKKKCLSQVLRSQMRPSSEKKPEDELLPHHLARRDATVDPRLLEVAKILQPLSLPIVVPEFGKPTTSQAPGGGPHNTPAVSPLKSSKPALERPGSLTTPALERPATLPPAKSLIRPLVSITAGTPVEPSASSTPTVKPPGFLEPATPTKRAYSPPKPPLKSTKGQSPVKQSPFAILSQLPFNCNSTTRAFGSTNTGTGLFSKPATTTGAGGLFGGAQQQPAQPSQEQVAMNAHPIVKAVGNPNITGNEKDKVYAELNQIAAAAAVGNAVYRDNGQIQTYNMENNPFAKFVGIGYTRLSTNKDEDGVVSLIVKCDINEIASAEQRQKLLDIINSQIFQNNANVRTLYAPDTVFKRTSDGHTEVQIIVKELGLKVPALKLSQYLNNPQQAQLLETHLRVDKTKITPRVGFSHAQLAQYLETPPPGIDENLWRQAARESPDPTKLVPVVIRGFRELAERQKAQIEEFRIQKGAMENLVSEIEKLETRHSEIRDLMYHANLKHKQVSYRLLRVVLWQWIHKRAGRPLDMDEDQIDARIDTLFAKLTRPGQVNAWIDYFRKVMEKRQDRLQLGAQTLYTMSKEDEEYARKFLTEILRLYEQMVSNQQKQRADLEQIDRTLNGP
ncbi:unnamed protein product [Caenorhabditis auriculariae]|uniref:Nucleoporin Nup54 alpha-helical domain-containing protein n=1 Tax=Caenorhabditis auriculariae TaxID=2777116 RepID=A0A8S1HNB5_9PELO|nr:unnamed protein product [Caenorhabditis auriculariae]